MAAPEPDTTPWVWRSERTLDVHVPDHTDQPWGVTETAPGSRALILPEDAGPAVTAPRRPPTVAEQAAWAASTAGVELLVVSADLARVTDEYGSFRSRTRRQLSQERTAGRVDVVAALLDPLDAFAAAAAGPAPSPESVAVLARALASALSTLGVHTFGTVGEPFDPARHDAVARQPGNPDAPVIAEVFRLGYALNDTVVRPAMVAVAG